MILVVAGLMVDDRGHLLIQQRPPGLRGGLWEYPGGKVNDGECMEGALQREWDEELGLYIEVGRFVGECVVSFEDAPHVLVVLFAVRKGREADRWRGRMGQIVLHVPPADVLNRPCVPSTALLHSDVERHLARLKHYGTVSGFVR